MNLYFSPQRASSGQPIFAVQIGDLSPASPPVQLVMDAMGSSATALVTGALAEVLVFVDEPAPRSRCILMDYQNRTIRL